MFWCVLVLSSTDKYTSTQYYRLHGDKVHVYVPNSQVVDTHLNAFSTVPFMSIKNYFPNILQTKTKLQIVDEQFLLTKISKAGLEFFQIALYMYFCLCLCAHCPFSTVYRNIYIWTLMSDQYRKRSPEDVQIMTKMKSSSAKKLDARNWYVTFVIPQPISVTMLSQKKKERNIFVTNY